ncbi:hypothetical protein CXG81DRAFT_5240, partial [Caulochytrium protostelioides]
AKALNRPMSPHLTIYRPQITSVASILNRITGSGLAMLTYGVGMVYGIVGFESASFALALHAMIPAALLTTAKGLLGFSFFYHAAAGLRHFVWDLASQLTIPGVTQTGYVALAIGFAGGIW